MKDVNELMNKAFKNGFIIADELAMFYDKDSDEYKRLIQQLKDEDVDIVTHGDYQGKDTERRTNPIDNILSVYIQDIKDYPLLDADEEIELGREIKAAQAAQKIIKTKKDELSAEELAYYEEIIDKGEASKEYFINCNLRLVIWWASKYVNRGLSHEDIIQEGNMGLIRAVEKFDPEKGVRFSTYASNWIRKYILRGIQNQARTIRLPVHISSMISKLKRVQRQLAIKYDREPTTEELSEIMGISPIKIAEYQGYISHPVSLDMNIGNEEGLTLEDFISNPNIDNPFDEIAKQEYSKELRRILEDLNPREYQVITLRFGFQDGKTYTLEEIGNIIGLTRERVRQIESKALRKLRHPTRSTKIKQLLRI